MITNVNALTKLFAIAVCFHFAPPHSFVIGRETSKCKNHIPFQKFASSCALLLLVVKLKQEVQTMEV
jgi:hypothetical protein